MDTGSHSLSDYAEQFFMSFMDTEMHNHFVSPSNVDDRNTFDQMEYDWANCDQGVLDERRRECYFAIGHSVECLVDMAVAGFGAEYAGMMFSFLRNGFGFEMIEDEHRDLLTPFVEVCVKFEETVYTTAMWGR